MKKNNFRSFMLILFISIFSQTVSYADIDVEMILNDGGFVSFDHFKAELLLHNTADPIRDARIFGIMETYNIFFYWPTFTTDIDFEIMDIDKGDSSLLFLEFDFLDIDDVIPFGPIFLWGAWYIDIDSYGYDVKEFWLDDDHKWTPTPNPTNTPSNTPTSTPSSYEPGDLVCIDNVVGKVRYIPATGSEGFLQGSPEDEPCKDYIEYPQFTHILTRNLAVMETEVTRQMWSDLQSVWPDLPDDPTVVQYGVGVNNPVQNITWKESILFANLLSILNGYTRCYYTESEYTVPIDVTNYEADPVYCNFDADGYRLPTEGEWEYFCRAGTTGAFFCPESNYLPYICYSCDPLDWLEPNSNCELWKHVLFCANSADKSEPVGSKLSNPWNLKDINGNVWEWCWDKYENFSRYPEGTKTDYTGEETGSERVTRGGSWFDAPDMSRSAKRFSWFPDLRQDLLGFRLVRLGPSVN